MKKLFLSHMTRAKLALRKLDNIHSCCGLSREGLSYQEHERRILLYRTNYGECIYMRYPGKESNPEFADITKNRRLNPYDFKPDLELDNGHSVDPGTNYNIGLMIESFVKENYEHKSLFISFLLNMAYYNFHNWGDYKTHTQEVFFKDGRCCPAKEKKYLYFAWFKQELPSDIQSIIENQKVTYDKHTEISVEALIHYIDVLAMQEDCKYQRIKMEKYRWHDEKENRDVYDTEGYESSGYAKNQIGRINFILTLANVAYCTGKKGQERTKELKELFEILKNNKRPKPIPVHKYGDVTDQRVLFAPEPPTARRPVLRV